MSDRDDVANRMGQRLEADSETEQKSQNDTPSQKDKNGKKVTNVKNAWSAKSVYLPDDLHSDLESEYKRLDYELDEYRDEFGKVRHYYPLVVRYGLDQLKEMDAEEIDEAIDALQQDQQSG